MIYDGSATHQLPPITKRQHMRRLGLGLVRGIQCDFPAILGMLKSVSYYLTV